MNASQKTASGKTSEDSPPFSWLPVLIYFISAAASACVACVVFFGSSTVYAWFAAALVGAVFGVIAALILLIALAFQAPRRLPQPTIVWPFITGALFGTTPFLILELLQGWQINLEYAFAWLVSGALYAAGVSRLLTTQVTNN